MGVYLMRKWLVFGVALGSLAAVAAPHAEDEQQVVSATAERRVAKVDAPDVEEVDSPKLINGKIPFYRNKLVNRKRAVACKLEHKLNEAKMLLSRGLDDLLGEQFCIRVPPGVEVEAITVGTFSSDVVFTLSHGEKLRMHVDMDQFKNAEGWAVADACGENRYERDDQCVDDVRSRYVWAN